MKGGGVEGGGWSEYTNFISSVVSPNEFSV